MSGTFTNLLYHVIFSTKDRVPVLEPALRPELYAYMGGIIRGEKGSLITAGGVFDHVHLLAKFPPALSVSEMLRHIKANSSAWVNDARRVTGQFAWQAGYGAFSVSESAVGSVAVYIEGQVEHHRVRTFQEEFIVFLERHGVAYDERYIWH